MFTKNGRDVAALVHEEFRATHPAMCVRTDLTPPCWYNAVTFARSDDGGRSFELPPNHFVAASTDRYRPRSAPVGIFTPSNIVGPRNGYYYALVVSRSPNSEIGSCLIRTSNPFEPSSWRASTEVASASAFRRPLSHRPGHRPAMRADRDVRNRRHAQSLTYNKYLDRYLLIGLSAVPERTRKPVTGIYFLALQRPDSLEPSPADHGGNLDPHVSLRRPQPDRLPLPDRSAERIANLRDHRPPPLPLLHPLQLRRVRADPRNRDLVRQPMGTSQSEPGGRWHLCARHAPKRDLARRGAPETSWDRSRAQEEFLPPDSNNESGYLSSRNSCT